MRIHKQRKPTEFVNTIKISVYATKKNKRRESGNKHQQTPKKHEYLTNTSREIQTSPTRDVICSLRSRQKVGPFFD